MAELLLTHGADRSLRTDDGRTPRDLAEAAGHPEVAELLD
jgi:ankyrin repeat protein